jgi:hypothetical protein
MIGIRIPAGAGNFFLRHRVQNGSRAHPASYPTGTGGSFPSCREMKPTTHLHLFPRPKNAWSYTATPQDVFMAWWLVKHRDNFTLPYSVYFITKKCKVVSVPEHHIMQASCVSAVKLHAFITSALERPASLSLTPANTHWIGPTVDLEMR